MKEYMENQFYKDLDIPEEIKSALEEAFNECPIVQSGNSIGASINNYSAIEKPFKLLIQYYRNRQTNAFLKQQLRSMISNILKYNPTLIDFFIDECLKSGDTSFSTDDAIDAIRLSGVELTEYIKGISIESLNEDKLYILLVVAGHSEYNREIIRNLIYNNPKYLLVAYDALALVLSNHEIY